MSRNDPYITKVLGSERDAARYVRKGWEVVSSTSSGTWFTGRRTRIIVRTPNPRYRGER